MCYICVCFKISWRIGRINWKRKYIQLKVSIFKIKDKSWCIFISKQEFCIEKISKFLQGLFLYVAKPLSGNISLLSFLKKHMYVPHTICFIPMKMWHVTCNIRQNCIVNFISLHMLGNHNCIHEHTRAFARMCYQH